MERGVILLSVLVFLFFVHIGSAQFEDCMSSFCHQKDIGKYPAINVSLFGVHRNINITDGAGNISNSDCVQCHYDVSRMFEQDFTVSTHTCEDCHLQGEAPRVHNHIRNAVIKVNAACFDCHNKTSNLFKYNANASAAHYSKNASFGISPGGRYCGYCHRNSSTIYKDVMQNPDNTMIDNHTRGILNLSHPAGNLDCTSCHRLDKLHGTNLTKPVLDSDFCKNCHNKDRLQKDQHAGKVDCTKCHSSDIHDIKYILNNGSYRGINATSCTDCHDFTLPPPYFRLPFQPADCTTCHQGRGLINFITAPLMLPVAHSDNPQNGSLWNIYWTNTSQVSMCVFCHTNSSFHSGTGIGKVDYIRSGNMKNQSITGTGHWCANCHYGNSSYSGSNYSYNGTAYDPLPPNISISQSKKAGDNATNWFNHTGFINYSDAKCKECHGSRITKAYSFEFVHNVGKGGGGPDCIACHDITGSGAPEDKRVNASAMKLGVHKNLNSNATNSSVLDALNKACWACHGNGSEPSGHPAEYKSPRNCSSDSCHSLNQEYRAPMIYSHFNNSSLNNNPNNVLNYNVTTKSTCEACHTNNVIAEGENKNSTASHYASLELLDSINCIYCHMNKNNSEKWGNAILIYKNRTALIELDRERNKFSVKEGEFVDLGFRFRLKVVEISSVRGSALIELLKDDTIVDRRLVNIGNYTYEEELTIDNATRKVAVIVLNITGVFKGDGASFIQFEGFRLKRVHAENTTTSCYLCHIYIKPRIKYRVIERVDRADKDDIFYTKELVNLTDKREFNETFALNVLQNITDSDMHVNIWSDKRKTLFEGEVWKISEEFILLLKEVNIKSDEALLLLRAGNYSYEDIAKKCEVFEYKPSINYLGYVAKNVTIFRANVSEIIQAEPKNIVVLEDVIALSPKIQTIKEKETIEGYNTSWLWENYTFVAGRIPQNFHSPQLFDGRDGGGDCLSCHGVSGFVDKKVFSLGKHEALNGGGNYVCYACHGGRAGIKIHPVNYKNPRNCLSCHVSIEDNYSAVYIGDEEHKNEICKACHIINSHEILRLDMLPSVKNISMLRQENKILIEGIAIAGYKMKVRDARYYIDSPQEKFSMFALDGDFDSQSEEIFAEINVSNMAQGKHVIYVEAMERKDKWGIPSQMEFVMENGISKLKGTNKISSVEYPLFEVLAAFLVRRFFRKI